jgi:AraC family transcriptional regulator
LRDQRELDRGSGTIHAYADASRRCASVKPNALLATSSASEWSSLLLDYHEGSGQCEAFETYPTGDLTLVVNVSGRHQLGSFTNGRWCSVVYQPGVSGLTPPNETARLRWQTSSPREAFRTVHVYLPGSLLRSVEEEYRRVGQSDDARVTALAFRDDIVAAQALMLLTAHRAGAPELYAASTAQWLVTHLLSRQAGWRHLTDTTRLPATITDRRFSRVIEFMSCHLSQPLTLRQLAHEAGISVHHFGRRFRERTGVGPAAYLATLRFEHARVLLRTTDLPISDIAARCGYPRPSAFSTAFLRHAGVTPTVFRTRC